MGDVVIPGEFKVGTTYIKVKKANGQTIYYKVENDIQTEISEAQYINVHKDKEEA